MDKLVQLIQQLAAEYGQTPQSLLPILQGIVAQERYLSEDASMEVAKALDISAVQVYGTATFYSFLPISPSGKYLIRVCKTITCMMHGKNQVLRELESLLKIKVGETTADGLFTLLETNCLGQCHKGPAMLVNQTPYTHLTPAGVREIILSYRLQESNVASTPNR